MSVEPPRLPVLAAGTTRRDFLRSAAAATAATIVAAGSASAPLARHEDTRLVDVNVHLGRWPLRRLPHDETERLVTKLRSRGVRQAWAGSLDALLSKDLDAVNARLADDCRRHGPGLLLPFGSVNPKRPGWEQDLEHCVRVHRMRGVRLYPAYHGYRLHDPDFARLLKLATDHGLVIQLALVMEDERMMHPLLRVEPVDPAPLTVLARQVPGLRLVLLNALRTLRRELLRTLILTGNISVEISMLEGVGGLRNLLGQVPADRVLFGSYAPIFYFEAAELKLRESSLTPEELGVVRRENARRLLA